MAAGAACFTGRVSAAAYRNGRTLWGGQPAAGQAAGPPGKPSAPAGKCARKEETPVACPAPFRRQGFSHVIPCNAIWVFYLTGAESTQLR